jgi:hypothetical protein
VTLALRRASPDDYDVIQDGEIVGRIYRMRAERELWRWTIRLWAPPPGPSGGLSRKRLGPSANPVLHSATLVRIEFIEVRCVHQVPKAEDPEIYLDAVFQVSERDGALSARPLSIRKSTEKPQ